MNSKYVAVVLAGVLAALVCAASDVGAQCVVDTSTPTYANGQFLRYNPCDANGNEKMSLGTLLACERLIEGVCVVEERYLTIPIGGTTAMIAADQLYKSGLGYVRSITCYSDATATTGTIALRDNTAAGAGNILWSFDVLGIAYNTPFTVDLQTPFSIGLYLDFTTTADVKCMVRFR
jgi:hypothetical protein